MRLQKRLVCVARREQMPMQRERQCDIGAWTDRKMHIGRPSEHRGARIDDDKLRPVLLRFADVRHQMNARCGRVDAPQHDQRSVRVVLIRDRRHFAV